MVKNEILRLLSFSSVWWKYWLDGWVSEDFDVGNTVLCFDLFLQKCPFDNFRSSCFS